MGNLGSSGAKEASYIILSAIAMMIGLSLIPTIVGAVAPTAIGTTLEATIVQFIPTGLALALLVIAFGVAVGITVQSHSAESKPIAIVIAVIVLVIGVGLITSISTSRDSALRATNGCTDVTDTTKTTCTYADTATGTAGKSFGSYAAKTQAEWNTLNSRFGLADTVLNYVVVGLRVELAHCGVRPRQHGHWRAHHPLRSEPDGRVIMGGIGSSGAKEASYIILSAIAMMIGLSLVPTIVGSVAPTIVVNSAALEATIVQFIPTGLALALLVIAFGVAVGITIQSHSAESKPIAIVIAVIVLVIGVGLITSISDARDSALAATKGQSNGATCNASATYTGSATATTARANADAAIASTSCDFGGHKEPTSVASPATSGTATVNRDADATLLILALHTCRHGVELRRGRLRVELAHCGVRPRQHGHWRAHHPLRSEPDESVNRHIPRMVGTPAMRGATSPRKEGPCPQRRRRRRRSGSRSPATSALGATRPPPSPRRGGSSHAQGQEQEQGQGSNAQEDLQSAALHPRGRLAREGPHAQAGAALTPGQTEEASKGRGNLPRPSF